MLDIKFHTASMMGVPEYVISLLCKTMLPQMNPTPTILMNPVYWLLRMPGAWCFR